MNQRRARCPNGSRKSPTGTCKKKDVPEPPVNISQLDDVENDNPQCPMCGYIQDMPFSKVAETANPSNYVVSGHPPIPDSKTFRSMYYNKFFRTPVHLLEKNPLFQVNVNNIRQFYEFAGIHRKSKKSNSYADCFLYTIFTLGLRNVNVLIEDVKQFYNSKISGVSTDDIGIFIENSFGLSKKTIIHVDRAVSNKMDIHLIMKFLAYWLKPGYATIITVQYKHIQTGQVFSHIMNVFNNNSELIFIDHQAQWITNNIVDQIDADVYMYISFGFFYLTKPVSAAIGIVNPSCSINFV